jgi:uncharacterized protein (TIGR02594 family)
MSELPWMEWAEGEVGQKEVPGRGSNPRILEYRKIGQIPLEGDDSDVPWCKVFVNAAIRTAGLPILNNGMALSITKDPHFDPIDEPCYGCVAVFWRGSKQSGTGHIGFYAGENAQATRVLVLGGNESDMVRNAWFPTDAAHFGLVGYYWPKNVPMPEGEDGAPFIVNDNGEPTGLAV